MISARFKPIKTSQSRKLHLSSEYLRFKMLRSVLLKTVKIYPFI